MKIGILSKFKIAGGSEFRCATLALGLLKKGHDVIIFSEQILPKQLQNVINKQVKIINFRTNSELLYEQDAILVVNTDSKVFTTAEFWQEFCDPSKINRMIFLYNFIVSPSALINNGENCLNNLCKDIRLITTNKRFYDELGNKAKLKYVSHLPRIVLESPISIDSVYNYKSESNSIRIGHHSKSAESKWNKDYQYVISALNDKYGTNKILWDFLGMHSSLAEKLFVYENVIIRPEFSISVKDYLLSIDIYNFFIDYKRQEPWSRAVAEAMMSGCPIVTTNTDGGNVMQVINGNNGFLCNSKEEFINRLSYLIDNKELREQMAKNSLLYSKEFETKVIINKLERFIS